MFKLKIVVTLMCVIFLVGCNYLNKNEFIELNTNLESQDDVYDLGEFLSKFVEKMYAPKSQTDVDIAVGNAIEIVDEVAMFHFLISLPKEINSDSCVEIEEVSYNSNIEGDSIIVNNIIIRFKLYSSKNNFTQKYVRFDFTDNLVTSIDGYSM